MQIKLNTEDVLRLTLLGLKTELGIQPAEIALGPINGEFFAIAAIGEDIPLGTFDDDDTSPDTKSEAEPAGDGKEPVVRQKRKRRTKAEIEADEAKAKAEAAKAEQPEKVTPNTVVDDKPPFEPDVKDPEPESKTLPETKPDEAKAETGPVSGEDLNLFNDDDEQADPAKGPNPFADAAEPEVDPDSLDLFSDENQTSATGANASGAGTTKADGDDAVLNLFE